MNEEDCEPACGKKRCVALAAIVAIASGLIAWSMIALFKSAPTIEESALEEELAEEEIAERAPAPEVKEEAPAPEETPAPPAKPGSKEAKPKG